jgi:hypothetical protein
MAGRPPGALHHIIIRGVERKAFFKDRFDRGNFLNLLDRIVSVNSEERKGPGLKYYCPG